MCLWKKKKIKDFALFKFRFWIREESAFLFLPKETKIKTIYLEKLIYFLIFPSKLKVIFISISEPLVTQAKPELNKGKGPAKFFEIWIINFMNFFTLALKNFIFYVMPFLQCKFFDFVLANKLSLGVKCYFNLAGVLRSRFCGKHSMEAPAST